MYQDTWSWGVVATLKSIFNHCLWSFGSELSCQFWSVLRHFNNLLFNSFSNFLWFWRKSDILISEEDEWSPKRFFLSLSLLVSCSWPRSILEWFEETLCLLRREFSRSFWWYEFPIYVEISFSSLVWGVDRVIYCSVYSCTCSLFGDYINSLSTSCFSHWSRFQLCNA